MRSSKRVALGLSPSSWPLLERLKNRHHVDLLALTTGAASGLESLPEELLVGSAAEILSENWHSGGVLVVVGAIGAIIRLIAPLLETKGTDPAVVALDADAVSVVPLIGGHKAGAEEFAIYLAEDLGAKPIITGDCSTRKRLALDSFGDAWGWKRSGDITNWDQLMICQAQGGPTYLEQKSGTSLWQRSKAASNYFEFLGADSEDKPILKLSISSKSNQKCSWHPPTIWIGVGCERNTSYSLLMRAVDSSLRVAGLAEEAVAGFATVDIKSNETALLYLAKQRGLPIRFFAVEELKEIEVPNPSPKVNEAIGSSSVAEASALLAAGDKGILSQTKIIFQSQIDESGAATIAIAESIKAFAPKRGELHLIGSGPGDNSFITSDVRSALSRCVVWIGYGLYLDLLEPLRRTDQVRLDSELTQELDRCIKALELASEGIRVALISSGDSGVYGMAGLALELVLKKTEEERPAFFVHPGVTAMQMAASRLGAPLMNDFCAISLSDKLIPWNEIEARLIAAAKADFVVAIYNPKSRDRFWQLQFAIDLFIKYRSKDTPVALARQLGRAEEEVGVYRLDNLPLEKVDMFTIVLVGNRRSFCKDDFFLTPRGYQSV